MAGERGTEKEVSEGGVGLRGERDGVGRGGLEEDAAGLEGEEEVVVNEGDGCWLSFFADSAKEGGITGGGGGGGGW